MDASRWQLRFEALDRVPIGVLVVDPEYRILYWNQCLENWTGIPRNELLCSDVRHRFPNISAPGYAKRIGTVFRDGIPTVFSPQLHAPFINCEIAPGVSRIQYTTVTSIPNDGDSGFLAVFSIQDITDLTRRLDESRRTAAELALELKNRMELQNDLHKAKEAADSANRAKSDFLANMSHEIRTPMNGILGMIGLLLQDQLSPRQRKCAETVRSSASDLLVILDDILDHSKIEADKLELGTIDFELCAVVEGVADLVAVAAQNKGVEILCCIERDVPTHLRGDPMRLGQIILNLAGNAVKFTHKGQVSIRVKLETPGDPVTLLFEVVDTGVGVSAEKAHLLFRPFSQADTTTTRRYGGTGLGLSIVARLAELMGGQAGFESEENKGSRFWFTAVLGRQEMETEYPLSLPGCRVLLADGNISSRAVIAEMLESWQCIVAHAGDTQVAMASLRSQDRAFDAVLADMSLPGGGAEQLCRLMQADPGLAETPLLVLNPVTKGIDVNHCRALGFAGHITKPVKTGELAGCLLAVIMKMPAFAVTDGDAAPGSAPDRGRRARTRILLVEDNVTNQEVALGMLENFGYRADIAADARSALAALAQTDYDLVLMDCQLPDLDGYEATGLIRLESTDVRNHQIPIVAMTAHAMVGDRERCLTAGMNDYLSKPIDPSVFEAIVERWTAGTCLETEAEERPPAPAVCPQDFDLDDLLDRLGGNEELAQRVIRRFLGDIPTQLAALALALDTPDATAVRQAAHAIKGAAANVGAHGMREYAFQLEQLGMSGDLNPAPAILVNLSSSFDRTRAPMAEFSETTFDD